MFPCYYIIYLIEVRTQPVVSLFAQWTIYIFLNCCIVSGVDFGWVKTEKLGFVFVPCNMAIIIVVHLCEESYT